jgi:succinate dehydrogenase / fumarate reductase flavoprotein subunit
MQGLADGYFVIPYTIGNYLADEIATKPIQPHMKHLKLLKKQLAIELLV